MDLDNYNFQTHVAQQSRRNKLRVQSTEHVEDYSGNLDRLNPIHAQIPNIRYGLSYDPSLISSEMHNFATNNSQLLSDHKDTAKVWVSDYSGEQNVYTIGEGSMSVTKAYDSPSSFYQEPSFDGYRGSNSSSFTNFSGKISVQNSQKIHEEMHYNPSLFYQNALPLTVVSSVDTNRADGLELASIVDQTNSDHWSRDLNSTIASDSVKQGLSLSLSPDGLVYPTSNLNSTSKQSIVASCNKIVGNTGPLGPFTGYAAILQNSKFLGPAQQLLGDMCTVNSSILVCTSGAMKFKTSNEERNLGANVSFVDQSRISSPKFYGSNENGEDIGRTRLFESFGPEYQQKKEKLLYMQEEVSRRHKQYNQQMEMVVSSFKSVSGLSAATPFISLAIKTISKNFRSLKHVISEQLKNIYKSLDDANTSSRGDKSSPRLKFVDRISGGCNLGISAPQPPHANWRTQRGLPERSVAVLRAWLFEHFLHPYPTDTDKHMLASQTGLTRDQVSNWFINARVRVWKPMVEEIHALETKNMDDAISNSNQEGISTNLVAKPSDIYATSSNKVSSRQHYGDQWDHAMEKRSRTEYQVLGCTEADTSFVGFMPNQRSGHDGLNPVSLTLGLRQSPDGMCPQEQQEYDVQQLRGQMVHQNFVG